MYSIDHDLDTDNRDGSNKNNNDDDDDDIIGDNNYNNNVRNRYNVDERKSVRALTYTNKLLPSLTQPANQHDCALCESYNNNNNIITSRNDMNTSSKDYSDYDSKISLHNNSRTYNNKNMSSIM